MGKLNRKAALLLCLCTVLLCGVLLTAILSGRSLARYISRREQQSAAGVAALNCEITYAKTTYKDISINRNDPSIYMVVDEFVLENTGEVAFEFDLFLVLSKVSGSESFDAPVPINHTTLKAPTRGSGVAFRQIRMKNASSAEVADVNFGSVGTGQSYTAGKVYYAVSTDGTNYTWHTANEPVVSGEALPQGKVYYRIAYFIDFSEKDNDFTIPELTLLYRVECEQVLK